MPLPRGDEYLAAVQNPKMAFNDYELKQCKPETDQFGIPKPYSGGFTTTFHLLDHSQEWAARCFTRAIPDLQMRYQHIGSFLDRNPSSVFVKAECLQQGIRVGSSWQPLIKMQWQHGDTLNSYIDKHYSNQFALNQVLNEFKNLVNILDNLGIAHGDLQHGNIIIKNDKLFLIDYDGMFLPALSNLSSNEIGHLNYQHPFRTPSQYNAKIDRFSSIVIYLGIKSLIIKPELWHKYDNSENILFRSNDFSDVDNSNLLYELSSIKELSILVERFIGICNLEFDKIPSLDQFINGSFSYSKHNVASKPQPSIRGLYQSQYLIIDATQKGKLNEHIGDRIEVIGYISDFHTGYTRYKRQPYLFLNFGSYPSQTFTLVFWSNILDSFRSNSIDPHSFIGKWVKITGVVGSYMGRPQMTIDTPSQINILQDETEARKWLGNHIANMSSSHKSNLRKTSTDTKKANTDLDVFNKLYSNRPVHKPTQPTSSKPHYTSPHQKNIKKTLNYGTGIIFAIIAGMIGSAIAGFWGFVIGATIGYIIGVRL